MRYWDSSAIVPLLVEEALTDPIVKLFRRDRITVTWWGTRVECASALARVERLGGLDAAAASEAFDRLEAFSDTWHEIEPGEAVRETAQRFVRVHDLRAADALQLSAAFWARTGIATSEASNRATAIRFCIIIFISLSPDIAVRSFRSFYPSARSSEMPDVGNSANRGARTRSPLGVSRARSVQ